MVFPPVICYGEVLWDLLPSGKLAGGAPMNIAWHLNNLGVPILMMSCVGNDRLGRELLEFLHTKRISTDFIDIIDDQLTGTASVQLDEEGTPTYNIKAQVAWDFITYEAEDLGLVQESAAVVYGSLASRSSVSRKTLLQLLAVAPLKIFDLNLRAPFYSQERIEPLLRLADVVKIKDKELAKISAWYPILKTTSYQQQMEYLKAKFSLQGILCTLGEKGACYLSDNQFYEQDGININVVDTIGTGDAFLSAFLKYMLQDKPIQWCLKAAAAMGALTATHKGGSPFISEEDLIKFIAQQK